MVDLHELRRVLTDEFCRAENRVVQSVRASLPRAKEDDITTLFVVEVARGMEAATENGVIGLAVRADLESAYQSQGRSPPKRLAHISDGLVARVRKHGTTEEIKTGGDFGLVLVEPRFDLRWDAQLSLRRGGKKRGMLVQAKRRLYGKRWNQFTDMQLIRLPERMNYAALARYEFADVEGRKLNKFKWHILAGLDISEVAEWLRSGKFQNDVNTSELITGLSRGDYGTGDSIVIERDICPDAGSYVVVEIDWKDGEDPAPLISRLNRDMAQHKVRQRQKVHILLQ